MANTEPKIDGIDKWEVESAAETLIRAEIIKQQPKLLKAARKIINQTNKIIKKIKMIQKRNKNSSPGFNTLAAAGSLDYENFLYRSLNYGR